MANYDGTPSNIGNRGWGTPRTNEYYDPLLTDPPKDLEYDTPEFWLALGIEEIQAKLPTLQERWDMYDGNHPLPNGDRRFEKALRDLQMKAKTNYIELVTKAPVQRMRPKFFRFGDDAKSDPDARMMWRASEMDSQIDQMLLNGAVFGEMYILVSLPDESDETAPRAPEKTADSRVSGRAQSAENRARVDKDTPRNSNRSETDSQVPGGMTRPGQEKPPEVEPRQPTLTGALPAFTVEDPRMCHVFPDPKKPLRGLAGVKLWKDPYQGEVMAVVYLPDRVVAFRGPRNDTDLTGLSVGQFTQIAEDPNPSGEVSLVRGEWTPGGVPEAEAVWSVQNRINHSILERLVISKSQAYRQRVLTGVSTKSRDKKNKSAPPFDPGASALWVIESADAKAQEFSQIDISKILEAIRDDVIDMATLTQTPAHYLMGKMSNVGGDTLTQAESGFVAKIRMRQRAVGWMLERAVRVGFLMKDDKTRGRDVDAECVWEDPEVRSRAENADAALKEAQVFETAPPWALKVLGERMGLEADQIEMVVAEAELWQQQQMEREEQMMKQQADTDMALAKEGAASRNRNQSNTSGSKPSNSNS